MGKLEFKYANRFDIALLMACKTCRHCKGELNAVVNDMEMDFDKKVKAAIELRLDCRSFEDHKIVERDTTYPGATYAPHDNNHPELLDDSSDIDHNPFTPKRCLNATGTIPPAPKINNWDKCLSKLFDRKREPAFPSNTEVMRLLCTSQIPQYTFKLGLPPQRGMGFERGLWFYKSEKFNSQPIVKDDATPEQKKAAQKSLAMKSEMKKLIMVYLYHVWFKNLDVPALPKETKEIHAERVQEFKSGIFMALEASDKYSLGADLSWWMLQVFKDTTALILHPTEDELEIEFIPMSLLNKAQEAAMLAAADCNNSYELDLEAQAYDEMLDRLGYTQTFDGVEDKDGHEIMF